MDRHDDKDSRLIDKLNLLGEWSSAVYLMWSDKRNPKQVDHRGNHVPLTFLFLLPTEELKKFTQRIKQNPGLLESVFQGLYPRLTGSGNVERLATNRLRVFEAELGQEILKHRINEEIEEYKFPKMVGENKL